MMMVMVDIHPDLEQWKIFLGKLKNPIKQEVVRYCLSSEKDIPVQGEVS